MKPTNLKRRLLALTLLLSLMLGPSVLGGNLLAGVAHAKGKLGSLNNKSRKYDKLGSDLREQLQDSGNLSVILQLDGKPSGQ
ncbi:MAG TPA: hypothetical protein VFP47_17490, partial [Pyrinomonadaceae bacterium]|nr:hypothetical protein [Pyrinomonadaceae bacterium]